jgi:beta-galactosidase
VLPDVPGKKRMTFALEVIKLTGKANLFGNLGVPVESERPLSFEDIDQGYGFVLYRTTLKDAASGLLKIKEMRDFATVYLNGKRFSVLDRRLKQDSMQLNSPTANATLDILVENNGRINYGPYLTENRQGITDKVTLNGQELLGWKMYKFPFTSLAGLKYAPVPTGDDVEQPALYRGTFSLRGIGDTYLDMHGFGKGFVFLNGHNLGKYWQIGPQQTLYVPAVWLKKGVNEVVVFDELKGGHTELSTLNHPALSDLVKE